MGEKGVVLLTGFEPFGSWGRNVSGEAVLALDGQVRGLALLRACVLPVAYPRAIRVLDEAIARTRPLAVAAFGIHGDPRGAFRVEGLARNALDFRTPDNDGNVCTGRIDPHGLDGYAPGYDLPELVRAIESAGLRAEVSHDAGRFLCNAVFFRLVTAGPRGCFVHVPPRRPGEGCEDVFAAVDAVATHVAGVTSR